MASMPTYHVTKGPFRYLDELFGGAGSSAFADALESLEGADAEETLRAAAEQREHQEGDELSDDDVEHFGIDWLQNWWRDLAPADTLRAGIREAITHAKDVNKPMEFLWICAGDPTPAFHVYYSESPNQVTVVIFTPPPQEGHSHALLGTPEPIWVVKLADEWDDAYPSLGELGAIQPPEVVAEVTDGPIAIRDRKIIKQQVFHT